MIFLETYYEIDDFTDYDIDKVAIPKEKFDEFNSFICKRKIFTSWGWKNMLSLIENDKKLINNHYKNFLVNFRDMLKKSN